MIAEIGLGLICLLQTLLHHKQQADWREERRLLMNREYAQSIPELATLQNITKPAKSDVAAAVRKGLSEPPDRDPRAPTLPMGL